LPFGAQFGASPAIPFLELLGFNLFLILRIAGVFTAIPNMNKTVEVIFPETGKKIAEVGGASLL
jgi:hypothetical protein